MDVLSALGALLGLITTTSELTTACYDYRRHLDNAPQHLLVLIDRLASFQQILETLMRVFDSQSERGRALLTLLDGTDGPLNLYTQELTNLLTRLGDDNIRRGSRFFRKTWPLTKKETLWAIESIERYTVTVLHATRADASATASAIADDVDRLARSTDVLRLDRDRREKLIRWLMAPDPVTNQNFARAKREPSTGSWFVDGTQFTEWFSTPRSVLWLQGPPGCGKTTLCSNAIDEALLRCSSSSDTAVAYFYFAYNDHEKQSLENLVRSLTLQLSLRGETDFQVLEELYKTCQYGQRQPSLDELTATLRLRLQELEATYIFIDAVDECNEVDNFLDFVHVLLAWSFDTLHFLATSREDTELRLFFDAYSATVVQLGNASTITKDDISIYIHETIINDPKLQRWPLEILDEIETTLRNGGNGMFRWVECQLDALRRCVRVSAVRKTLASLPRTLDETYERILMGISPEYETEALRLLQWVTYSNRPLRIEEVAEALAIDDLLERPHLNPDNRLVDPHDTLTICPDLVVVSSVKVLSENGDTIEVEELRFAHFSVKEYLTSSRCSTGPLARYSVQRDANRTIALSCIGYLSSISANNLLEDTFQTQFPLYHYASHEWFYHVKESPQQEDLDQLDTRVEHLLDPSHVDLVNWLRMFDPDRPWSSSLNPHKLRRETCSALYYASSLGLLRTVRRLILHGAEVNWTGGSLGSPLQAAAYHGHRDVVALLIEKGADCMIRCGHYGTALQAAKFAQHKDIIKDLEKYDRSQSPRDQVTSHIHLLPDEKAPFEVLDSIGGGGSGIVEKVRSLSDGRICVRKTCKTPTASARKDFLEEVRIMQKLQHVHVVEVLGSYSRGKSSSILLLPLADKDLGDFMEDLDRDVPSQVDLLVKWTVCLVEGLRYIHSQHVKHKDIKPQNLLVHGEKILYTDFGIAHDFEGSVSVTAGNTGMTRRYSAPEVVAGDERSRAADIFSLGCVFLEMLGAILEWRLDDFEDDDDYATYVQENRRSIIQALNDIKPGMESFQLRGFDTFPLVPNLTLSMLTSSPQDRPRASVLVSELNSKSMAQRKACQCC